MSGPCEPWSSTAPAGGEPVSLTGHIRARTEQSLAFRIDGRMIARHVDVGQNVKAGEVVAELDPQPKQDALRAAQAKQASAQAALREAANNIERQRILVAQGWSTRVMFDAAEKKFLAAKADVDSAAADLHAAEDQLGYTKLLADFPRRGDRQGRRGRRGREGRPDDRHGRAR